MKSWESTRTVRSVSLLAHIHGVATAGAILTCVAVAFSVPPFTGLKKIDGPALASGEPARTFPDQSLNGAGPVSPPSLAPSHFESAFENRFESSAAVADSSPSLNHPSHSTNQTHDPVTTASITSDTTNVGSIDANSGRLMLTSSSANEIPNSSASEIPNTPLNLVPPNTDNSEVIAPFAGVWAPDAGTCSARNFQGGVLPAVLSADGAWAGETFCMFTNKKQTQTGWNVVAKCSSPTERWTANVRLTVKDDRLTWTSKRGSQLYTRCPPDVLTAAAR